MFNGALSGETLAVWGFLAIIIILLGFAAAVLLQVFTGKINLSYLISEPIAPGLPTEPPKASLSRFQFLIFTFVIAGLYLLLCIEAGTFIDIPGTVLGLLGISGSTFVASKMIGTPPLKPSGAATGGVASASVVNPAVVTPPVIVPPQPPTPPQQ
jgi:hypothetical protein